MLDSRLLPTITHLGLPPRYQIDTVVNKLQIRQLLFLPKNEEVTVEAFKSRGVSCRRIKARTANGETFLVEFCYFSEVYGNDVSEVIRAKAPLIDAGLLSFSNACFVRDCSDLTVAARIQREVRSGWHNGIRYKAEVLRQDGTTERFGLRKPQVGALHAIAAHWTLSQEPAIVIMPTGTGKTEVMIATAVASMGNRILVIVPTDALRQQTAEKFQSYGLLKKIGIIDDVPNPVVGVLSSKPQTIHFDPIKTCNVVISTMSSVSLADEVVQRDFAGLFTHVFFDEAHHVEAASWKRFQKHCNHCRILLFTATPFREDGKALPGKIIYNFPLCAAQEQEFFQRIHFAEVFEPDSSRSDLRIAETAVNRLRQDLAAGYNHILLARAATIDAASQLFNNLYLPLFQDLNPVMIHSRTPQKRTVLDRIRSGEHRIIVCVDMFGEGFDLPNLKVAALHTVHKSLGITLQFIGRFARASRDVGPATFVANTADDGVPEELEGLYQENADWNSLLADLSYDAIDPQARLSALVENLVSVAAGTEGISISTIALRPKISAQVYRTNRFFPDRYKTAFRASQHIHQPQISRRDNLLVLIVNQRDSLDWTDSRDIAIDSWDLFIAYFDPARNLLYVHSSRKGDAVGKLAREVSETPVLIKEDEVFKVFANLRRLTLHSVGLTSRSRNVRYQMFAGLDVRDAIDPVQQQSKMKSNVTGVGFEEGKRCSVGCSRKGKIWSMTSGSLAEWKSWCDHIGSKLADCDALPDDFLKYTLIPVAVTALPPAKALMVDWPDQLFESTNFKFNVIGRDGNYDFHDCELLLGEWEEHDLFTFALRAGEEIEVSFSLQLQEEGAGVNGYVVQQLMGPDVEIETIGSRLSAGDFFSLNPPLVRLEDGSQLSGNILLKPQEELQDTYDRALIQTIDWNGTDITKESRWKNGAFRPNSVQQRFVEHLEQGAATFIIDDDDTGESADIVAIEEMDDSVIVNLWHCKYSDNDTPGQRADDLYVVCGQAQKSVKWTWSLNTLIKHLMTRETKHTRGRPTRFVRGSLSELVTLGKSARRKFVVYKVGIVQPGASRNRMPADHIALLGATNSFIHTVTNNRLMVVVSE